MNTRYAPTSHERSWTKTGAEDQVRMRPRLTDEQIREEYRKMPFINRIVRMGASVARVRKIVRASDSL